MCNAEWLMVNDHYFKYSEKKKSTKISETETECIRVELELQRPQSYKMQPRRHIFSSLGIFFMLEHVTNVFNRKYYSGKLFSSCKAKHFGHTTEVIDRRKISKMACELCRRNLVFIKLNISLFKITTLSLAPALGLAPALLLNNISTSISWFCCYCCSCCCCIDQQLSRFK